MAPFHQKAHHLQDAEEHKQAATRIGEESQLLLIIVSLRDTLTMA